MIFVSYYSGENYKICSKRLEQSLLKFRLPYYIQEINSSGDKQKNIAKKPEFVRYNLLRFQQPICWIDADSEIIKYPELLMDKDSENINLQIYNWYGDKDNHVTRMPKDIISKLSVWVKGGNYTSKNKLLCSSGTFAFNYSKESLELLDQWISEMRKNPTIPDDQVLDNIFNDGNWSNKIKYRWLPKSYNRMTRYEDWLNTDAVINNTETHECIINR